MDSFPSILRAALIDVVQSLEDFAADPLFAERFSLVFGADAPSVERFAALVVNLPAIEILADGVLDGAAGAFSAQTGKIYLSESVVNGDPALLRAVLLEEVGHYLDAAVNVEDTPGDEGELFSAIAQGVNLSASKLIQIKTEDDHVVVMIGGQETAIEMAASSEIANSVTEFSGVQGQNNWYYGYYDGPFVSSDFQQMTQFATNQFGKNAWLVKNNTYWTYLSSTSAHGNGTITSNGRLPVEQWSVRRWISEVNGNITITGQLAKDTGGSGGNGVIGHILVDGVVVWSQAIDGNNTKGINYYITTAVNKNSTIDFALDPRGSNDFYDASIFTSIISGGSGITFGNSTYYLTTTATWMNAEAQAVAMGGHLVTVNDAAENQFLVSTFGGSESFWIGYTDSVVEGQWKWISGETSTYTNWNVGEPNNFNVVDEDYAHLIGNTNGKWNDLRNSQTDINPVYSTPFRGIVEIKNNVAILAITSTSADQTEGNSGSKAFTFTVNRSGNTTGSNTINWAVSGTGTNPANGADFVGGILPSGIVSFAAGETSKVITVNVQGDTTVEPNETFRITLSNPTNGATITTATAKGTIQNDDMNVAPSHKFLEVLAKDIVYRQTLSAGQNLTNDLAALGYPDSLYKIDKIWGNKDSGFYAVGITAINNNAAPILVLRGTNPLEILDWLSDTYPIGIGFDQFRDYIIQKDQSNSVTIYDWLQSKSSNAINAYNPYITGHSLGGALTQWIGSYFTDKFPTKYLNEIVTFNSPGIQNSTFTDPITNLLQAYGPNKFRKNNAGKVTHYITSSDAISLGGFLYLDGNYITADYNSIAQDNINIIKTHLNLVLQENSALDGLKLSKPMSTNASFGLSSPLFNYNSDLDFTL